MLAKRLEQIGFSDIRKVYEKANQLERSGHQIINLLLGEPDLPTPEKITDTALQALSNGDTHYTSNYGIPELRKEIAEKLTKENGIDAKPSEILVTVGASEAIFLAMMAILNDEDEVLIPCPTWMNYGSACRLAGGVPVLVPLQGEKSIFSLSVAELEKRITPKSKMLILTTPGNPTGAIYDSETLKAIAELAIRNDLVVLADEIYEKVIYDGVKHISIASLPGMKERTITINGFSKAYAMTGWRIGYLHACEEIMNGIIRVHQFNVTCLPGFTQHAASTALLQGSEDVVKLKNIFCNRRDMVVEALNRSEFFDVNPPKGAIYLFLDIRRTGKTSEEFASELLEETGVALVPGTAFGQYGEGYVRLSFAASEEALKEACLRIVSFAGKHSTNQKQAVN